jgi:hypothetical protein
MGQAMMNVTDLIKQSSDFIDQFIPYVRKECGFLINPIHKNEMGDIIKEPHTNYDPTTGLIIYKEVPVMFSENVPHFEVQLIRILSQLKCR